MDDLPLRHRGEITLIKNEKTIHHSRASGLPDWL